MVHLQCANLVVERFLASNLVCRSLQSRPLGPKAKDRGRTRWCILCCCDVRHVSEYSRCLGEVSHQIHPPCSHSSTIPEPLALQPGNGHFPLPTAGKPVSITASSNFIPGSLLASQSCSSTNGRVRSSASRISKLRNSGPEGYASRICCIVCERGKVRVEL